MSDSTPTPADLAPKGDQSAQADPPKGETKPDATDWVAEARKWEQRAKENKAAADELAAIKEAQKSDAERSADALRAAQSDAEQARAELLRYKIAASHGITDADDIALFLTGTDEDTLTKQATRLAERSVDDSPRPPKPDPNQGRSGATPGTNADAFAAHFQGLIR